MHRPARQYLVGGTIAVVACFQASAQPAGMSSAAAEQAIRDLLASDPLDVLEKAIKASGAAGIRVEMTTRETPTLSRDEVAARLRAIEGLPEHPERFALEYLAKIYRGTGYEATTISAVWQSHDRYQMSLFGGRAGGDGGWSTGADDDVAWLFSVFQGASHLTVIKEGVPFGSGYGVSGLGDHLSEHLRTLLGRPDTVRGFATLTIDLDGEHWLAVGRKSAIAPEVRIDGEWLAIDDASPAPVVRRVSSVRADQPGDPPEPLWAFDDYAASATGLPIAWSATTTREWARTRMDAKTESFETIDAASVASAVAVPVPGEGATVYDFRTTDTPYWNTRDIKTESTVWTRSRNDRQAAGTFAPATAADIDRASGRRFSLWMAALVVTAGAASVLGVGVWIRRRG